jgi:zinc finger protein
MVSIPYFKEVVLMSTTCDSCGYKSNEVKAGGPVALKGKKISIRVQDTEDLSRDILKSESCGLSIPEIDLELSAGTLGGRFTTVEGLLRQVHDELRDRSPFTKGDSTMGDRHEKFEVFLKNLEKVSCAAIVCGCLYLSPDSVLLNVWRCR